MESKSNGEYTQLLIIEALIRPSKISGTQQTFAVINGQVSAALQLKVSYAHLSDLGKVAEHLVSR